MSYLLTKYLYIPIYPLIGLVTALCPTCRVPCTNRCPCICGEEMCIENNRVIPRYYLERCPDCTLECLTHKYECKTHKCGEYEEHFTIKLSVGQLVDLFQAETNLNITHTDSHNHNN